jgi:hypothetical protein
MSQDQPQYRIPPVYSQEDDEIQIGPFFSNLRQAFLYVFKKWYVLLIFIGVFVLLALGYKVYVGTKFVASTSFAVEGTSTSAGLVSSALSLANALGIQASSPKSNTYDNNFFATLIQSRKVIMESLMVEGEMNGKKDLMANHYVTVSKWREGSLLRKGWNESPVLKDFSFSKKPLHQLTGLEDSVLNVIYSAVIDKNLEVIYDEASPFNIATFTTRNRDFSRNMMKIMVDKSAGYYMDNVYELNKKNLSVADLRVDSLGRELKKLDYRVASMRDVTNNTIAQRGLIGVNSAARDQALLNTQYSAAVNNVELAKVTLLTTAPILQIIDDPVFSTQVNYVKLPTAIIVGILLGLFFGVIYLLIARAVKLSNERVKEKREKEQRENPDTAAA